MKLLSSFTAGIKIIIITIMMKFSTITSVLGVAPRNMLANSSAKIIIYIIASEQTITMYEKSLSHIEERFKVEYLKIV